MEEVGGSSPSTPGAAPGSAAASFLVWDLVIGAGLGGDVQNQPNGVADLAEGSRAHIASDMFDPARRDGSYVLTLGRRSVAQSVCLVGFDENLRPETTDGGGERHDLDHVGLGFKNMLSGDDNGGMTKAGFSTGGGSQVESDDVTRGQHRASRLRPV